jgi:hypothetical protein
MVSPAGQGRALAIHRGVEGNDSRVIGERVVAATFDVTPGDLAAGRRRAHSSILADVCGASFCGS